jgi:hypothetical protein
MQRPSLRAGALLAIAGFVLAVGGAPLLASGADHLDAPALGGLTGADATVFAPHSDHGDRDINDVYAFQGSDPSRTVLVMTTNPAINLFGGAFGTNVRYVINVDKSGDAVQDLAYVWTFGPVSGGAQDYTVTRYEGANAVSLNSGNEIGSGSTGGTGIGDGKGQAMVFAGVRSDPFFFDLTGFVGTLFKIGTDKLGSGPTDFFANLNTNAVVIEVRDNALGPKDIGVWGATWWNDNGTWKAADQMGRPAINTVFNTKLVDPNAATTKNNFNVTPPSEQRTAFGGQFRTNIITTLKNVNAVLGTGHADYDQAAAEGLADVLLPDLITYDTDTAAAGPLNGRGLADDVIDAELGITTNGAVTSDGVGAHKDYLTVFPYLGPPHAAAATSGPAAPAASAPNTDTLSAAAPAAPELWRPLAILVAGIAALLLLLAPRRAAVRERK